MLAHVVKALHMTLAIAFPLEAGVHGVLVDGLSIEIRKPRLDISRGHEDPHAFVLFALSVPGTNTTALDLSYPLGNLSAIGIDEHNQGQLDPVPLPSVLRQLFRETFPDELLAGPTSLWANLNPLHPEGFARTFEKPAGEHLLLAVFAQDNYLNLPAHCSHPLAMTSDSLSPPSTVVWLERRTVVAPELSCFRTSPLSAPR